MFVFLKWLHAVIIVIFEILGKFWVRKICFQKNNIFHIREKYLEKFEVLEKVGKCWKCKGFQWVSLGDEQLILVFASHCAPARGLRERALQTFLSMFLQTFVKFARSAKKNHVLNVNVRCYKRMCF